MKITISKPNTKAFKEYKSELCEQALKIKSKINKLTEQYNNTIEELEEIFAIDDKPYFSESGTIKKEVSNSYSIEENNVNKVMELLQKSNLTIDDYVTQKTSWGVTAKMRNLLVSEQDISEELQKLTTVKTIERLTVKTS